MALLSLAGASTYCGSLRLSLHHWMTGFLPAQITDMLASSFVPLEPFSVLPQAMLYLGCQGQPGVLCLLYYGGKKLWWGSLPLLILT